MVGEVKNCLGWRFGGGFSDSGWWWRRLAFREKGSVGGRFREAKEVGQGRFGANKWASGRGWWSVVGGMGQRNAGTQGEEAEVVEFAEVGGSMARQREIGLLKDVKNGSTVGVGY